MRGSASICPGANQSPYLSDSVIGAKYMKKKTWTRGEKAAIWLCQKLYREEDVMEGVMEDGYVDGNDRLLIANI